MALHLLPQMHTKQQPYRKNIKLGVMTLLLIQITAIQSCLSFDSLHNGYAVLEMTSYNNG